MLDKLILSKVSVQKTRENKNAIRTWCNWY